MYHFQGTALGMLQLMKEWASRWHVLIMVVGSAVSCGFPPGRGPQRGHDVCGGNALQGLAGYWHGDVTWGGVMWRGDDENMDQHMQLKQVTQTACDTAYANRQR